MKTVTYTLINGKMLDVEYDETLPCVSCGLPVTEASMGGTSLCPWCDMGVHRNGTKWTISETLAFGERMRRKVHNA